jgi:hypothetical protein
MVERLPYKQTRGNILSGLPIYGSVAQWIERRASDADVVGSSPATLVVFALI